MKKFLGNSRKILRKGFRLMLVVMLAFIVQACRNTLMHPAYGMPDAPEDRPPVVNVPMYGMPVDNL